uniref:Rap guanine nucleotide exchange factor 3 n=1 Tax=Anas platyrhynchos TaxID=8839 RepID=A0A8B9R1C0_ANAPL
MHLYQARVWRRRERLSTETPLLDTESSLEYGHSLTQASSEKIWRAGKLLFTHLTSTCPGLIRDHKHHLRHHRWDSEGLPRTLRGELGRAPGCCNPILGALLNASPPCRQCCSGKELVDWLLNAGLGVQTRSQAVGVGQVLVDGGVLTHVKQEWHFQDKDTQFYRFAELELSPEPGAGLRDAEELLEAVAFLAQLGPDALLTMALRKPPAQRTEDELELIFEELLHIKAVAHLSNSVKRELAAVLMFESHQRAGTVLFSQGDKGTSWYIVWKGSVNVVTHGKGLVATLHEGDDFGQLALVNDAPRAASIILREDNCHFLRVDKQDFNHILKVPGDGRDAGEDPRASAGVHEARRHALRPRGHPPGGFPAHLHRLHADLAALQSPAAPFPRGAAGGLGAGEGHLLPAQTPQDPALGEPVGAALRPPAAGRPQHHGSAAEPRRFGEPGPPPGRDGAGAGTPADPSVGEWRRQRFSPAQGKGGGGSVRGGSWDPPPGEGWLWGRHRARSLPPRAQARSSVSWLASQEEAALSSSCALRAQDKVPYEIYRPDHSCLVTVLPINASVRDVLRSLAPQLGRDREHLLVKVNSAGDKVGLQLDAVGVFTSLGLNERLFAVSVEELGGLTPHPEQLGPHVGSSETLDLISSKDLASHLTDYDWNLFKSIHQVEMIHYIVGPQQFHEVTTANLERVMRRFNELQYWVATELCLCPEVGRRAQLLRKFIKLAAHLKEQKNLNSFFAVMFGVSNTAVSRLAKTWERLPHKIRKLHAALERMLDPSWNHRVYRLAVAKLSPPIIPFVPLLLKDMTFIHEGNRTLAENLINFEKMHMMAKTVRVLQRCRGQAHAPLSPLRSRSPHRPEDPKAVRMSTCSEQSLSVRSPVSTWAYLQHLKAIDSQKELLRLSRDLES